jgi:hypothetical protein
MKRKKLLLFRIRESFHPICAYVLHILLGVFKILSKMIITSKDVIRRMSILSSFGGLEVARWLLEPKFVGSNPAEAFGFFRAKKSSARLPSEGK